MKTRQRKVGKETFLYIIEDENQNFELELLKYGYIQYYICYIYSEVQVLYVYVDPEFRGKGYGEILMKEMFNDVSKKMEKKGIERFDIKLDDMSDRFAQEPNLYRKTGFQYCEIDDDGPCGPEMSLTISLNSRIF